MNNDRLADWLAAVRMKGGRNEEMEGRVGDWMIEWMDERIDG